MTGLREGEERPHNAEEGTRRLPTVHDCEIASHPANDRHPLLPEAQPLELPLPVTGETLLGEVHNRGEDARHQVLVQGRRTATRHAADENPRVRHEEGPLELPPAIHYEGRNPRR